MQELSVEVLDQTNRVPPAALHWLTTHVEKAARHIGAAGEVRVRVVDDGEMAQAHEEFAGVEGTTDVLTFDMTDPEEAGAVPPLDRELGKLAVSGRLYGLDTDILVCLDEANRQSGEGADGSGRRCPVEKELLLYVVHGILHCLGMDDHDEAECVAMHRVEDAVLTAIGVGPVYSAGGPPPGQGANG